MERSRQKIDLLNKERLIGNKKIKMKKMKKKKEEKE